ncbi:MAG: phosphoribosyltransferase [Caldilineae bacterium]|nr:MAG: phosphoribosyltransferase [Caldilineae bacterium]
MQATPREELSWQDVEALIDRLLPQVAGQFDIMLLITRGGIIPGGMLAESLDIKDVLVASVEFPKDPGIDTLAWPTFSQFPSDTLLRGRRVLVVDDVWDSGRTINTVRGRVEAAGGQPKTCVLHYKPARSRFPEREPDFYAAITDRWIIYPWELDRGPDFAVRGPELVLS